MAKLTPEARAALKDEDFVFPKERRYPTQDLSHGVAAMAFVSKSGTPEEKAAVRKNVCSKYPGLNSCKSGEDPEPRKKKKNTYEDPLS